MEKQQYLKVFVLSLWEDGDLFSYALAAVSREDAEKQAIKLHKKNRDDQVGVLIIDNDFSWELDSVTDPDGNSYDVYLVKQYPVQGNQKEGRDEF